MNRLLAGTALLVVAETAAFACSCLATDDPAELRRLAAEGAGNAIALVAVEALSAYADGQGERMRVIRTAAGQAPPEFTVERGPFPSSASCDQLYEKGQRAVVVLRLATRPSGALPTFRISGLCETGLLERREFRDEMSRLIEARDAGERG